MTSPAIIGSNLPAHGAAQRRASKGRRLARWPRVYAQLVARPREIFELARGGDFIFTHVASGFGPAWRVWLEHALRRGPAPCGEHPKGVEP